MAFPLQIKTFENFGGLKQDISQINTTANYALVAQNCRFRQKDIVRHRDGYSFFNSNQPITPPYIESPILGLYQFKYSNTDVFFIAADEYIYVDDGTNVVTTTLVSGQDTDNYYSFCSLNDQCYIVNSVDTNLKYGVINATTTGISNMCIVAPDTTSATTTLSTSTATTSGLSAGTYGYLFTYVNVYTGQESNPDDILNYISATVTAGDSATITQIPYSTDPQVTEIYIYRTTVNGSIYDAQFCTSVENVDAGGGYLASVSSSTDAGITKADTSLLQAIQLFHAAAPKFKKVITHKNKVFGFEENSTNLQYSYDFNGWYWPDGSNGDLDFRIQIDKDDGDYIQDVISFSNVLLVFKSNTIHVIEGYDETDFFRRKIEYDLDIGAVNHRATIVKNNLCYFVDRSGIYATDGNSVQNISGPVQGYFNTEGLMLGAPISKQELGSACVGIDQYKSNKIIKFSFAESGGSTNTLHLIYNYELNQWSVDTGYIAQVYCKYEKDNDEILIRGDNLGYVCKESTTTYDGAYLLGSATTDLGSATLVDTVNIDTDDEFNGCYITITKGVYYGETRRIVNTVASTGTITVDSPWTDDTLSQSETEYIIGGSEYFYITGYDNYGDAGYSKRLKFVRPRLDCSKTYNLDIFNLYDFNTTLNVYRQITLSPSASYDDGVTYWDGGWYWGIAPIQTLLKDTAVSKVHNYHAYGIRVYDSTAKVVLSSYDKCFQVKGIGRR
jgi:hypothetical protein